MTSLPYDAPVEAVDGSITSLADLKGSAVLVVNVASRCGLTPQFEQLEELQKKYAERGLTVIGFPCNQFNGQSPEGNQEMADFCSATYGTTFPILGKIEVNGEGRHAIYDSLVETTDAAGEAGDIQWNFEKFLIAPDGEVVGRFRPKTLPDADEVIAAIEAVLPR
jgi:glutathione peroxidase